MRVSQSARARQSFMREAMLDYPVPPREELLQLWNRFDYNGNGLLSLAEIDKLVREEYPQYDDKQALLRAYTFADADGSGFITKNEFATLVRSLAYFKALAEEFREVDASGDRRIDFDEFLAGAPRMGLNLGIEEARAIFAKMDTDNGGLVLFEEFCAFVGRLKAEKCHTRCIVRTTEDDCMKGEGARMMDEWTDKAGKKASCDEPKIGRASCRERV